MGLAEQCSGSGCRYGFISADFLLRQLRDFLKRIFRFIRLFHGNPEGIGDFLTFFIIGKFCELFGQRIDVGAAFGISGRRGRQFVQIVA